MLSLLLLVLYLFVAFLFGAWGLKSTGIYQNPKLSGLPSRIVINLCFALSLNLLFAHLLAFPLQNFALAAQITSFLITALAIYYFFTSFKEDFADLKYSKTDFVILSLAFLIALSAGIRGHLTDSDNTHIPWSHSLVMNHKYPPRLPIDPTVDLGFYHYGTDLYIGSISSITGAMPWDSISMQVAVGCFLAFLSFFVIFNYFFESKLSSLFATLFIFFFTSETSICFFYKYFGQIIQTPFPDLMKVWQDASLVSSVHMPYFAVLVSQNMALAPLLIVFLMAFLLINKSIKPNFFFYLAVAVLSYSAYSCYPAWWYPGLAAFLGFFLIDVFISKQFKSSLAFLAVFALVKFLSFDGDAAALNGVKAMVFKPSLYWEHYAMNFLGYFDLSKESHLILTLPDYVSGKIVYNVHLFTWLTFINWGLLLIIATILLICNIKNIFTNKTWIFYLTALPGLAFPFLFDYILRPSEVYRFTAWGKLMLLLYIILNVGIQLQSKTGLLFKITKPLLVRIVLVFHLLLLCVPGVFSVLPSLGHFNYLSTDRLSETQKKALKVLMKYHQQDTTCLTTIIYYSFCDITNIAGFWGVGGQFYKPDLITRQTALYLLNPILLTDLKVTHVLIDVNQDKLSNEAVARLNDRELFEEILELNQTKPEWRFYRFVGRRQYTAQELAQMQREYMWVLGSKPSGAEFVPAFQYSHYITGSTRNQITEAALIAKRDLISSGQIAAAVWLSPQAMANLKQ